MEQPDQATLITVARINASVFWKRFMVLCSIEDFGEQAVLTEGKRTKNFLGAAEKYESIYKRAVEDVLKGSQ